MDAIGRRALVQIVILAVLLGAVYWQTIKTAMVYRWINDGTWSYGWLVPLFSIYFLSTQREVLAAVVRRMSYAGLVVMLASLACYFMTIWVYPYSYPRALTLLGVIVGLTLFLGGWDVLRAAWFPIAFLAFAIPLPQSIYVQMTMPLQKLASIVTTTVLSLLPDVHAEVSGIVIDYSYGSVFGHLNVEQACSGMRSMMAIVTLGVAMAYLGMRPAWQRIVMVICCVPIAIFCNIVRVTTTGLLHVFKDSPVGRSLHFEWFTGATPHALLGMVTFMVALGLFVLVGWVLGNLMVEEAGPVGERGAGSS